ncbi:MAG: alcohol dehydrogenase family protein [Rhizobiaceae bacterium]
MTTTMKAFVLTGHGELDQLVWHENWPRPEPGPDDVLIKVHACGLNNTDVNTRTGWYSKAVTDATTGGAYEKVDDADPTWGGKAIQLPRIQGADAVGTVEAVGANVDPMLVGKRVMTDGWMRDWNEPYNLDKTGYFGSEADGGFAEYTKTHHNNVLPVESPLSDAELATFSCSYTTAENMLNRSNVGPGDRVLITGASGGVGSALIQLANRRGATTIAMASAAKHDQVTTLNPDFILDRAPENLADALAQSSGSSEVDVVVDIVGGDVFPDLIGAISRGGRYACSGAIAGPIVEFDLRTFYLRDLSFFGCTVTATHTFADLVSYIEKGEIKPILAASYPLQELKQAQQAFIDKKHTGNIVVTVGAAT